jgi:hypothetical protein
MGSLNFRIERLEQWLRPGVVRQVLSFPTKEDADRYLADPERQREGPVFRRVYIGVDLEQV